MEREKRPYTKEDFKTIVVPACVEAVDWDGGALSYVKQALHDNGIFEPRPVVLDGIVFAGMERAEEIVKKSFQ